MLVFAGLGAFQAQEAVPASGGDAVGTGGSSSYTVGQTVYTTHTGTNGTVSQGVQQPYEISTVLGIELEEIKLKLKAFPNPTIENLTLSVGSYISQDLSYKLYNIQGKFIQQQDLETKKTVISMLNLPSGPYLLSVYGKNRLIKIFKIIKN